MMTIVLLVALFLKHFICDFAWQTPWMLAGKGDFRSLGGYAHAGLHALWTAAFLWGFDQPGWLALALFDFGVHYLVDWWKVRCSVGLTPADRRYWIAFGLDQLAHAMTYIVIVALLLVRP